MVFTTRPRKVSTLGLIRARASQRTIASSSTPQPRPKALVQVMEPRHLGGHLASACSWMVVRLSISISRLPLGVTTTALSPTFLFSRARPMGELVEILPAVTSDSSLVTSLYSTSEFLELSYTRTVEPRPILSLGILSILI